MLRSLIFVAWLGVIVPTPICAQATVPPPNADGITVATGVSDAQATVVIYSTMDAVAAQPLIEGFREANPQIGVQYLELNSNDLYERFLAEVEAGRPSADLLLSSAMDLQLKLANDGYALAYSSAATSQLPDWAVWRNEAFGFTFEPVAIIYNKDLVPPEEVPSTRYELAQLLHSRPEAYFGKVATYDPERSGFGFLLITQDAQQSPEIWDLVRAFGESKVKLYSTTAAILDRLQPGPGRGRSLHRHRPAQGLHLGHVADRADTQGRATAAPGGPVPGLHAVQGRPADRRRRRPALFDPPGGRRRGDRRRPQGERGGQFETDPGWPGTPGLPGSSQATEIPEAMAAGACRPLTSVNQP
jgi:hypothetical protein